MIAPVTERVTPLWEYSVSNGLLLKRLTTIRSNMAKTGLPAYIVFLHSAIKKSGRPDLSGARPLS
jgi:hypothetical protein